MKRSLVAGAFLVPLSSAAFGQQAKLEGYVVDDRDSRVPAIRIVAPGGQSAETDSQGHFTIAFPSSVRPGQATRVEVAKPNWVVYEPLLGNCVTQSSERNYQPLKVIIVPKASPLALSPKRLSQVISKWADERAKLRSHLDQLGGQLDEYVFLREYSEKYGFTLDQFVNAAQQWAQSKESDDKEEQAGKEYFLKNYDQAAHLAHQSALAADEELERDNKRRLEDGRKVIRRYKLEGSARSAEYKFREALAAYNEIEKRFSTRKLSKEDLIDEWADIRTLLGSTKEQLGTIVEGLEGRSFLSEAAEEYRQALTVYTYEQQAQQWATTQGNLGVSLMVQGTQLRGEEGVKLCAQAIEAFRQALKVFTREHEPQDWAITQLALAYVLQTQGERLGGTEGPKSLARAVEACHEALKVFTREERPQSWARTQNTLGIILSRQGELRGGTEGRKLLALAVEAHREALKVPEQPPQQWAAIQVNLGGALVRQGEWLEGEDRMKLLAQAVEAFRAALTVYTRELWPLQWAAAQSNLGESLRVQGEKLGGTEGTKLLALAVDAYRQALKVFTYEQDPQHWAAIQVNLGGALLTQGEWLEGEGRVKLLAQAVEAFRATLTVYTREQRPLQWAAAQSNLGESLRAQGEKLGGTEGAKLLALAVDAYRQALKVFTHEQGPQEWASTQLKLAYVLQMQGEKLGGAEGLKLLAQAVDGYRAALTVYTRDHTPGTWARTQVNLGIALSRQGGRIQGGEGIKLLDQSVQAYRAALTIYTREQTPHYWVISQTNLAEAYVLLRNWVAAAESYANVLVLYPDCEEAYIRLGAIYHETSFNFYEAFALNQQWLVRHPHDIQAQADLAEKYFTTGRFAECEQQINALLIKPDVRVSTRIALQGIQIADLLALGLSGQAVAMMEKLLTEVSSQPAEFRIERTFYGVKHFIGQHEKLSPYRAWLEQLFTALAGPNRDQIIKGLNEAKAAFQ